VGSPGPLFTLPIAIIIKKKDDINVLPVPHVEEKKTIIKKEDE
jgi:hypothetical protein